MSSHNIFNTIEVRKPGHSRFNLSYDHKFTGNMGELIPFYIQELVPSDKFTVGSECLLRFQPLIAPVMHKIDVTVHYFFVPNRLLWPNWEDFITGATLPQGEQPAAPYFNDLLPYLGSPADYFGLPHGGNERINDATNAMPFAAYQKIYCDYYQDQNLIAIDFEEDFLLADGNNSTGLGVSDRFNAIRRRAWNHDYFTSCLPFAQKGEAVTLPMQFAQNSKMIIRPERPGLGTAGQPVLRDSLTGFTVGAQDLQVNFGSELAGGTNNPLYLDPQGSLYGDATSLNGELTGTINDLRTAYSLQRWLEKNARGGTRYIESILAHFGVKSSDARLQRAEFLGGYKQPVVISEVLQTSETAATPQANMAGHAISVGGKIACNYFAEEHGFIIGIMSVMPHSDYFQGVPKLFRKLNSMDYYWPDFALLGEQAVENAEVYYQFPDHPHNQLTFGYLPRYSEYRFNPNRISGELKTSLDFWTLARRFNAPPVLNDSFINCDPSNRIFAVDDVTPTNHHLIVHVHNSVYARRPMPKYGTPGMI